MMHAIRVHSWLPMCLQLHELGWRIRGLWASALGWEALGFAVPDTPDNVNAELACMQAGLADITQKLRAYRPAAVVFETEVGKGSRAPAAATGQAAPEVSPAAAAAAAKPVQEAAGSKRAAEPVLPVCLRAMFTSRVHCTSVCHV